MTKKGGGFILVGDGYGGLLARVFAARNAKHISGQLYLDPQTEPTYFNILGRNIRRDVKFFFRDVLGTGITPLGIRRWLGLLFYGNSRSRESRVLGTAASGLSPSFGRSALQQAYEAHSHTSASYHAVRKTRHTFPNHVPSILISSKDKLRGTAWQEGQEDLANHVLGSGLIRWEYVAGSHDVCGSMEGIDVCRKALKGLL